MANPLSGIVQVGTVDNPITGVAIDTLSWQHNYGRIPLNVVLSIKRSTDFFTTSGYTYDIGGDENVINLDSFARRAGANWATITDFSCIWLVTFELPTPGLSGEVPASAVQVIT